MNINCKPFKPSMFNKVKIPSIKTKALRLIKLLDKNDMSWFFNSRWIKCDMIDTKDNIIGDGPVFVISLFIKRKKLVSYKIKKYKEYSTSSDYDYVVIEALDYGNDIVCELVHSSNSRVWHDPENPRTYIGNVHVNTEITFTKIHHKPRKIKYTKKRI